MVSWLERKKWCIRQTANTAAKAQGKDIVATKGSVELWVSVKGFPTGTERTNAATQARHWFAHALFDVLLYRDERRDVELAIALPAGFPTYGKLAGRVRWLRDNLPLTFLWVSEDGEVCEER